MLPILQTEGEGDGLDPTAALVMLVFMALVPILLIIIFSTRYKKVPPDKAMVVFGRRMPSGKGYVVLAGGGKFIMPVVESYELLDISAKVCEIELKGLKVGGPGREDRINISTTTTYKVSSDPTMLDAAVEHLLHVPEGELRKMVQGVLEGMIRAMCAELTAEQIEYDLDAVAQKIAQLAESDLNNLGIEVRSFAIKSVERKD